VALDRVFGKRLARIVIIRSVTGLPDDLNLLLALDVLLAERHVTRAAKRLGITQSAASQRLRRLREHFGDPLLVDARPLLSPTPRAEALRAPLRAALAGLSEAVATADAFDAATSSRRFVVVGNDAVEASALPPLLAALRLRAPGISLTLERPVPGLAERLGPGGADLAVVPSVQAAASLRQRVLFRDPFVVLMRRGHALARQRLTLARYAAAQHVLIAPQAAPGSLVDEALGARGLSRRVVATVRHFASAPLLVASTDAIVTCPRSLARTAEALLPVVSRKAPLELPVFTVCAVWHARVHADPGHMWLRALVAEVSRGATG
jgi:DNA-binding transcriptional LysR family regulator